MLLTPHGENQREGPPGRNLCSAASPVSPNAQHIGVLLLFSPVRLSPPSSVRHMATGLRPQAPCPWSGLQPPGRTAGFCSSTGRHPGTLSSRSQQGRSNGAEAAAALCVGCWCAGCAGCLLGGHRLYEGTGEADEDSVVCWGLRRLLLSAWEGNGLRSQLGHVPVLLLGGMQGTYKHQRAAHQPAPWFCRGSRLTVCSGCL